MSDIIDRILNFRIITIIGLAKNVSKTTTLNYLIKNLKGKIKLGLTSIGRDGEKYDVITELPKPRIYIEQGTIVATAEDCYKKSKIPMEMLKKTGISTPLGEVLILKATGNGLIELAGPSINTYLYQICLDLKQLGCDIILIDGAFDRRAYATPLISEATILSTGASVSRNITDVVNLTRHTINLLTLKREENQEILSIAKDLLKKAKVSIINLDNSTKILDVITSLDSAGEIIQELDNKSKYLVINGAVTDKLLNDLLKTTEKYKEIIFLVEDATKLFLSEKIMNKFNKKGGILRVIYPINIVALTINPTSPYGYEFSKDKFLNLLKKEIKIPIYDLGVNNEIK